MRPRQDDPGGRARERHRPDPDALPQRGAGALRLLLPLRRRDEGAGQSRARLRDTRGGWDGGRDAQRADRGVAQDRARTAAQQSLRRLHIPLHGGMSRQRRRAGIHRALGDGAVPQGGRSDPRGEPPARHMRPCMRAEVRGRLQARGRGQSRRDKRDQAVRDGRPGYLRRRARVRKADGQDGRHRRGWPRRAHRRLVPRAQGA